MLLFLSLCGFLLFGKSECLNGYYFVIAPNILRFEHDEKVSVSVFGLSNADVKVWLEYDGKTFSEKRVTVIDEKNPATTTVRVSEGNVSGTVVDKKPRLIRIWSDYAGDRRSREVLLSYHSGYLIVQTDKPIYTPLQKVKIRTLALEESLKPSTKRKISMEITSPANMTMARITKDESVSGFYSHDFMLPPYPDLGVWTARAFYRGQFETSARVHFQVEEYVLPTFGVTIDVNVSYIMNDTASVKVTVRAKYVYGKPVDGTARLTINLKKKDGSIESLGGKGPASLHHDGGTDGSIKEFNIETQDSLKSLRERNLGFPDGSRLEVIARVYESATGKEEARSHDNTIFTLKPFQFHFTRSKANFRPGWAYFLKIDMTYANGEVAAEQNVKVTMFHGRALAEERNEKTDKKGKLVVIFPTSINIKEALTFKVSTRNDMYESDPFKVAAYEDTNQIQVEATQTDTDTLAMRALTNIRGKDFTGMLFMIMTRGEVVYTLYSEPGNDQIHKVPKDLEKRLSPSARLLVFYVDKVSRSIVADSVRFDLDETCQAQQLTLETKFPQILPGGVDQLTVKGAPLMWVGLNAMDKALLLLNDKNILKKNQMFEALKSHDIGCGEGSGKSSGDVFKKAGLTVLTNALVTADLDRDTEHCETQSRRKRDNGGCFKVEPKCCELGYQLVDTLSVEDVTEIDPYTWCYAAARKLALVDKLPTACIMAYFFTCKEELEILVSDETKIVSKSLDDVDDYASDLERLAKDNVKPVTRSDFRESWLFEVKRLDHSGEYKQMIEFPHSITEWMVQGIGITENNGMCIAEPLEVKAFQEFFIQLDLPYKAVRLEYVDIRATVFRYGLPKDLNATTNVYIESVEQLCFNGEPNKPSPKISLEIPPNSANTVVFPVVPIKAGIFPIKVTAILYKGGIPQVDVIEKKLYVVNEGVEEQITIQVCLDPNKDKEDCKNHGRVVSDVIDQTEQSERIFTVDLTLPENSITGTGGATGYIQSNILDNVVKMVLFENVESLFGKPHGCGEQTMIYLSPTVYALNYLQKTKQMTKESETRGNSLVREGVTREVSLYRKPDFSYCKWQHMSTSTWLTAFVAKVFCQAKKIVDDAVNEADGLDRTIDWLVDHVESDGSYKEYTPVVIRSMLGHTRDDDPSLTSFILVSLLECSIRNPNVQRVKRKTMHYIEKLDSSLFRNNPHFLALSTYALALAGSAKRWQLKEWLKDLAVEDEHGMRWIATGSAESVETTGYALLAMLEFNDLSTSGKIVRWLTTQRNAMGFYRSTQDTVVGLQALSTYNIRTYSPDVNLEVTMLADNWPRNEQFLITNENALVQRLVRNLPVEFGNNRMMIRTKGTGSARLLIDLRYNRPATADEVCPFKVPDVEVKEISDRKVDVNIAKLRNCDVCGKCDEPDNLDYSDNAFGIPPVEPEINSNFGRKKRQADNTFNHTTKCIRFSVSSRTDKVYGMSIVDFGLETDVEIIKEDLDKLMKDYPVITMYEMPKFGSGFVIFYLDNITTDEIKFTFRIKDKYAGDVSRRQPSYVKVYDYYKPEDQCTQIYGTGPNRGGAIGFRCSKKDDKQCKCLQSVCAQPVKDEILQLVRDKKGPAVLLKKYSCNSEKADYAVRVQIDHVSYIPEKEEKIARGIVQKSIHRGTQNLRQSDEMTFYWKQYCDAVELETGKSYYIIGKDGHNFEGENGMRYPVMSTTLVVEESSEDKLLTRIMNTYERIMTSGCQF